MYTATEKKEIDFIKSINTELITGKENAYHRFVLKYKDKIYHLSYQLLDDHSLAVKASKDAFILLHKWFRDSKINENNFNECIQKACTKSCSKYGTIITSKNLLNNKFEIVAAETATAESYLPEDFIIQVMDKLNTVSQHGIVIPSILDSLFIKITAACVVVILILISYVFFFMPKKGDSAAAKTINQDSEYQLLSHDNKSFTYIPPESPTYDDPKIRKLKGVSHKQNDKRNLKSSETTHIPVKVYRYRITTPDSEDAYVMFRSSLPENTFFYTHEIWTEEIPFRLVMNPIHVKIPGNSFQNFLAIINNLMNVEHLQDDKESLSLEAVIAKDLEEAGIHDTSQNGDYVEAIVEFEEK